jgi:hypothetical protein
MGELYAAVHESERGTFRTWPDVRLESAFGGRRKSNFGAVRSVDDPVLTLPIKPKFLVGAIGRGLADPPGARFPDRPQ